MKRIAVGLALLLAGCDDGAVTKGPDGKISVRKGGKDVLLNTKDCARPGFVPLYADARVTTCVTAPGTLIYTSDATPGAMLAWYRKEAEKAGLKITLQTDMNLAASEGDRKLMVMAMPMGSETQVNINWKE